MFEYKTFDEVMALEGEALATYKKDEKAHEKAEFETKMNEAIAAANKNNASSEDIEKIRADFNKAILAIKGLTEDGKSHKGNIDKGLRDHILENSKVLKTIKDNKSLKGGSMDFTLKATQVASDINSGADYAQMIEGTIEKPVRKALIMDLFRRKAVSTEYIKYREENVVTRDAKFVIACASSTHTTKKSWIVRTVELAKIRDIVDACIDMLDDYAFVESEVRQLIEESIKLKADYELLLGVGVASTDMLSIETVSSEFNPANVLANFSTASGTPFQDANLEQLADAMSAQISVFGEQNAWMANTLVMNFKDFVNYRNLKDANGNKLMHTLSDSVATIAGLRVVTSPIVAADTCYVFDSSKGEILDRQAITVKTSYENNDNIEHETVTFVAVERLQFHVANINRDAFMKCSGVAAAIALITAP
jgi:HK97 family phage major capsid protein